MFVEDRAANEAEAKSTPEIAAESPKEMRLVVECAEPDGFAPGQIVEVGVAFRAIPVGGLGTNRYKIVALLLSLAMWEDLRLVSDSRVRLVIGADVGILGRL